MRPSADMAVMDDRRVAASRCSAAESWGWPSGAADRTIPKSFGLEAATHRLLWAGKDSFVSEGDDLGWVDYFQWTGATEPLEEAGPDQWDTTTYVYDPAGRRIAKAFDGQVAVRYVYDGDHCIAEYNANDVLLRRFIYGPGVDQPICMIEADGPYAGAYYYHFDGLGSVVALSDASGDTVQTYEYSVFGRPAAADPNHPNPYLFTARRFDPETGLYHYRARAYNPYIGRFLQTDPIGYADGMNLYAYCGNNPLNFTDPSGCFRQGGALWGYLYYEKEDLLYKLHGAWNTAGFYWQFYFNTDSASVTTKSVDGVSLWIKDTLVLTDAEWGAYDEWSLTLNPRTNHEWIHVGAATLITDEAEKVRILGSAVTTEVVSPPADRYAPTTAEYIEGFLEGWSRGAQGVANAFTGGLFVPEAGLFYDHFNRQWNDAGYGSNRGNSGFRTGQNAGRVTVACLLAAGLVESMGANAVLEGPRGTRIFQMRNARTGQPIFRFDRGPVPGHGRRFPYHSPPDLSQHKPFQGW